MKTFFSREEYFAEVQKRGLQMVRTEDGEDFAYGAYNGHFGNFGCGSEDNGDDGCEAPGYTAMLFERPGEFEREYQSCMPLGCPTGSSEDEEVSAEDITPIEILWAAPLPKGAAGGDCLVPEQCVELYVHGKRYQVTVEPTSRDDELDAEDEEAMQVEQEDKVQRRSEPDGAGVVARDQHGVPLGEPVPHVELLGLSSTELEEAAENSGYYDDDYAADYNVRLRPQCVSVFVNTKGETTAVYMYFHRPEDFMGLPGDSRWEIGHVYISVRNGKRFLEY